MTLSPVFERRIPTAHGCISLAAVADPSFISIAFVPGTRLPIAIHTLSLQEAKALAAALTEFMDDLDRDVRARAWSKKKLAEVVAAADASAESYQSKP